MSVLKLRPHLLEYLKLSGGYEDENGDYHEGQNEWVGSIPCDAVPSSGQAIEKAFEDGVTRSYSYVVYMSAGVSPFSIGDKIRINFTDGRVVETDVKGFQRYQLQCKMWV